MSAEEGIIFSVIIETICKRELAMTELAHLFVKLMGDSFTFHCTAHPNSLALQCYFEVTTSCHTVTLNKKVLPLFLS